MCVDTGASITIIYEIKLLYLNAALLERKTPVFGFSACKPFEIIGEFEAKLIHSLKSTVSRISVLKGNIGCLLSCSGSVKLETVCFNECKLVKSVSSLTKSKDIPSSLEREALFAQYQEVFTIKVVKLKGIKAKLNINPKVKPVIEQKHRHLPHHLKAYYKAKIRKLIEDDVI